MTESTDNLEQDNTQTSGDQMQTQDQAQPDTQSAAAAPSGPIDEPVDLSSPEPLAINMEHNPDIRIASADDSQAVPLDDSPHPGVDLSVQYPWQLGVSGVYRNLNIAQIRSLHLDLGHEPSLQLTIDPSGQLALQSAITLMNVHWMPPWNREVEVGLSGLVNTTILPHLSAQYGGQLQAEQHIVDWFSITLSATGAWTPGTSGNPGKFELTGAAGAVIHFDGL